MGNTVGRQLSQADRAYLAGLIDGDGSVMARIEKHSEKKFGFRVRIALKITQCYQEDVNWLPKLTGLGRIRPNRKAFEWIVLDQEGIRSLLTQISPSARIKHRQMKIACEILKLDLQNFSQLQKAAQLADS